MQNWRKLGLIDLAVKWNSAATHFAVPFAMPLKNDIFRIYFSPRDANNCAFITYADVNILSLEVISNSETPILLKGELGAFDDAGVVLSQILDVENRNYLYYTGWMLGISVPFYFWIGLAIAENNGVFIKHSNAPVLPCHEFDPFLTGAPYIRYESPVWKMWYISGTKWAVEHQKPKHYYTLKYAESTDGINWVRNNRICLPYKNDDEYAIARPCIIREDDIYKMWFSYRGSKNSDTYRIGYAESSDGLDWHRLDEQVGLDVSLDGWDSEMICYSHVIDHNNSRYMLYNGNGYGKTGIGLAILEK